MEKKWAQNQFLNHFASLIQKESQYQSCYEPPMLESTMIDFNPHDYTDAFIDISQVFQ